MTQAAPNLSWSNPADITYGSALGGSQLNATADGDGTLLDHTLLLYGAGMGDSNLHAPTNLPVLIAGGAAGHIKTGVHIKYDAGTPMANLHLRLLDIFGVRTVDRLGDSTGAIEHLTL